MIRLVNYNSYFISFFIFHSETLIERRDIPTVNTGVFLWLRTTGILNEKPCDYQT